MRQQKQFLDGGHRRGQVPGRRLARRGGALQAFRGGVQCHFPIHDLQIAVDAQHRLGHPISGIHAFKAEAITIGDPGFVDVLILARHHAHQLAAQHMRVQVGAEGIVRRHQRGLSHFPGARVVAERFAVERADRTQIDDVRRQLMIDAVLDVGADFHVLAAAGRPHLRVALNFRAETHAAGAMNTARHVGGDQGTQVLVLDDAFALAETGDISAESQRQILQLALAALIADRAIERMIDEQKFHGGALRRHGFGRLGENLHALGDWRRTGRQRLGGFLHLDQAHAAVRRHAQFIVVAKSRNINVRRIRDLHDHLALAGLQRDAVDFDIDRIVCHALKPRRPAGRPIWLRPP